MRLLLAACLLIAFSASGEELAVNTWTHVIKSEHNQFALGVSKTNDGGFIVTGNPNGLLLRLSQDGAIQWKKRLGLKLFLSVFQTKDGGYAEATRTAAFGTFHPYYTT